MQNPHRYQCRARCRGRGPGWGTGGWRKPGNCIHGRCHDETKLSQHEPRGPTSGTKLSLLAQNGSIWRFFDMQGEFYTVVTTKKLSRENFVPNTRQSCGSPTGHQAPPAWRAPEGPVWRAPEGPVWRARAGFEAQSLAAVPVGGGGARPQYPQTTGVPIPSKFRMQFPHDTDPCTLKNRRISTIRLQHLKYTQGNCMRNWWESGPWGLKQRHAGGLARSAAGQRPLSGWRAALLCHGLGYSPGAPRRPNRTRREWTRGRSTGRRAPWPRSCREP